MIRRVSGYLGTHRLVDSTKENNKNVVSVYNTNKVHYGFKANCG
ncbi:UNVERIFIED_ORG: hypothetical protein [Escherichia phage CMSTMSU]